MTREELVEELVAHRALLVHCSHPGKGGADPPPRLFPDDLQHAQNIVANEGREVSCSVVWPDNLCSFGAIGMILNPRSERSVASVCAIDGGSTFDPDTGKRIGASKPLSKFMLNETFAQMTNYNEWTVTDADTVRVFINRTMPLEIAVLTDPTQIPGYEPALADCLKPAPEPVIIPLSDVFAAFQGVHVFSYRKAEIVELTIGENGVEETAVDPAHFYRANV